MELGAFSLSLAVKDIEASRKFYEAFGFQAFGGDEEATKLKQQEGQDIGMSGSGTLVQSLLRHNLIDELNLLIYPVVLGRGKRLFEEGVKLNLKLKQSKTS